MNDLCHFCFAGLAMRYSATILISVTTMAKGLIAPIVATMRQSQLSSGSQTPALAPMPETHTPTKDGAVMIWYVSCARSSL
jgi:hypothetical protein